MVEMIKVRCSLTRAATGSVLAMSVFVYWPKRTQAMLHLCVIGTSTSPSFGTFAPRYSNSRTFSIPSPICFLVALDKLLKDHGNLQSGIQLTPTLLFSHIAYADDAALPDKDVDTSSSRLTHLAEKANEEAGMEINNIPKTMAQHVMHNPPVSNTTEEDIDHFNLEFQFKCDKCDMSYPTKHGLSVHQGRRCKKRKNAKKPSRKGTVADRIVQKKKKEEQQKSYPKVKNGNEEI